MVLYYAVGGGMGHVIRANAICSMFDLELNNTIILVSPNTFVKKIFRNKAQIIHLDQSLSNNTKLLSSFISNIIKKHKIDKIFFDTFPCGIKGEFNYIKTKNIKLIYIARLLNWKSYIYNICNFIKKYDNTYIIEPIESEHYNFIKTNCNAIEHIQINYTLLPPDGNLYDFIISQSQDVWLVVHSQPIEELTILYEHAIDIKRIKKSEAQIIVVTQIDKKLLPQHWLVFDCIDAYKLFAYVDKIFTACGFNSMLLTLAYSNKHHFIPFKRKYDNQFMRAIHRKKNVSSQ